MTRGKTTLLLLVVFVFVTIFAGCAPARKPVPRTTPAPAPKTAPAPTNMPRNATNKTTTSEAHRTAKRLADDAAKVNGVKSATVVISNQTAIVGLDLKANIEANKTDKIKQEVTNRIKKADKNIKTVSVSSDADTVTRIKKVAKGISEGRPISEFAKEVSEITRRITPSVK